jgi:hypothetical protein
MFGVPSEQLQDLLHAKLACTSLSAFKSLVRKLSFLFL